MEYHIRINELPANERPRERLKQSGVASLSNSELLAIILRTGTHAENVLGLANRLLVKFSGLPSLSRASFNELCNEHGVGQAKAAQIQASMELGRRSACAQPEEKTVIRLPTRCRQPGDAGHGGASAGASPRYASQFKKSPNLHSRGLQRQC